MASTSDDHLYTECGLSMVMLSDVTLHECAACGERVVALPRVDELHREVALGVIAKRPRLTPREARFLRSYLGWSSAECARYLVATTDAVARWEDVDAPEAMPAVAERLLRLMVSTASPGGTLRPEELLELGVEERAPACLRLEFVDGRWRRQPD
jgi:DNA-binding transcriptional regulator YiaG